MNKNKTNYIVGDLYFENDKLFIRTALGEDLQVRETDTLLPLVKLSNGNRERSPARKLNDLLKSKRHINKYKNDCYLFHNDDRRLAYVKNDITILIDCIPGDKVTVVKKYWMLDNAQDERVHGILKELDQDHFTIQLEGSKRIEKFYFKDIRNLVERDRIVFN